MDIISKIKDLFALASSTSSLEEAATATALAQKLLDKHQLSLADLGSINQESVTEEYISKSKNSILWKGRLLNYIANSNYTRAIHFAKVGYKLIGRKSDIELVNYFWTSIVWQIETLAENAIKNGLGSGKRFSNSFKCGATNAVINRLKISKIESNNEAERTLQGKNALIWLSKKNEEVEQYLNRYKLKKIKYQVNYHSDGYRQGELAGQTINIAPGLNTEEKQILLLEE